MSAVAVDISSATCKQKGCPREAVYAKGPMAGYCSPCWSAIRRGHAQPGQPSTPRVAAVPAAPPAKGRAGAIREACRAIERACSDLERAEAAEAKTLDAARAARAARVAAAERVAALRADLDAAIAGGAS